MQPAPLFLDDWILARRPPRNQVSPERPYAYLVEQEPAADELFSPEGDPPDFIEIEES